MVIRTDEVQFSFGAKGLDALTQRVALAAQTPKGTVPLYREFGADHSALGLSVLAARPLLIGAITDAVRLTCPEVDSITFGSVSVDRDVLKAVMEVSYA